MQLHWESSEGTAENDAHGRTECRRSARTRTRDCGSMRYRNTRWRTSRKRCSGTEEARTKDSLSRRVNRERVRFEIFDFFDFFPTSVVRRFSGLNGTRAGVWGSFDGAGMREATVAIGVGIGRSEHRRDANRGGSLDVDFDFGINPLLDSRG